MDYGSYLRSSHWQRTRDKKLISRKKCQVCDSEFRLNVHHKHYKKSKTEETILFNERNEDLLTVCNSCHKLIHKYFGICKKLNKKLLRVKQLMKYGILKKKAFFIVSNDELFISIYPIIKQHS